MGICTDMVLLLHALGIPHEKREAGDNEGEEELA